MEWARNAIPRDLGGRSYVQAVKVKQPAGTLYVSGQDAVNANGTSNTEDMKSQIIVALQNLEQVVTHVGYEPNGIVRLTIYRTSSADFWPHFSLFQDWITKHGIKQATTLMEVKSLFETLKIEFEATVVK